MKKRFRRKPRTFLNVNPTQGGFVVRHQVEGKCAFFLGGDRLWVRRAANATPFSTREQAEFQMNIENEESNRSQNGTSNYHD
jgi:hypothetical protein